MRYVTFCGFAGMLPAVTLSSCSVALPRAPDPAGGQIPINVSFKPKTNVAGYMTVSPQAMIVHFDRVPGVSCLAVFPGQTTQSTIACDDGLKGNINMHWQNGDYVGSVSFTDGVTAYLHQSG